MKNKDRLVKVSNLENKDIIYTIYKRKYKNFHLLLIGLLIVFFVNIHIMYKLIAIFIFFAFVALNKKGVQIELRNDSLIYYLEDDMAILIYYDEILSYQINEINYHERVINLIMKNKDEYSFAFNDIKAERVIDELIGDKNAKR